MNLARWRDGETEDTVPPHFLATEDTESTEKRR
jgi:hypothetical protein